MDENKDNFEINFDETATEESPSVENGFVLVNDYTQEEQAEESFSADNNPLPEQEAETLPFVDSYSDSNSDFQFQPKKKKKWKREKKEPKPLNMTRGKLALVIAGIIILAMLCGIAGSMLGSSLFNSNGGNNISRTDGYTLEDATGSKLTVAEIVEKSADSVVEITTESTVTDSWMMQYVTEGAGSGVIIDSEKGYIITNNHVVEDASKVQVTLRNGDQYDAKVIGVDSSNDVAVIKIDADDLTAATYGNSEQLVVGELAVAIGNPLGELGGSVTSGIISALDRQIDVDGKEMTLLQTDASINPGNSGGGLFNQYGQLIGIVVAKSSGSDVEGLGFAIPINTAADVAQQIIKAGGNISSESEGKALIGVSVIELDKSTAQQYGYENAGVYIQQISALNAQKAGLQIGDMFVKVDGKKVSSYEDLSSVLNKHKPGDTIEVIVLREGKEVKCKTELVSESATTEQ